MQHKNLTVCKANKVIEAGYKLSLNEQRVILACISQVNSVEELFKTDRFELSGKDFAKLYGISEDRSYSELQSVAKQLFHRYVIIDNPDPENPKIKRTQTHWISSIDYLPDDGKIILYFAPKILPYLGQLKGKFTSYKLEHIGKMTCIYAIRLYELLVQWQTTGKREVEIDWLKKQFQLDEGYDRMDNFKARVLDPAIKDINEHSNFQVSWTQRKSGRRVTHLTFYFSEKASAETKPKEKEKRIGGVKVSEIEKLARPGESWEEAARRIKAGQKKVATANG
jgi:plasmid replication initiation protein